MKTINAKYGQTVSDIAIRHLGAFEAAIDVIDMNPDLKLDLAIPSGYKVVLPKKLTNRSIADYYQSNDINPVSGFGQEAQINNEDMTIVRQKVDYDLSKGNAEFPQVRLQSDKFTVQINYSAVAGVVTLYIDQSLDGLAWSHVPDSLFVLDTMKSNHTYNVIGLISTYARIHVEVTGDCSGKIDQIIWKL